MEVRVIKKLFSLFFITNTFPSQRHRFACHWSYHKKFIYWKKCFSYLYLNRWPLYRLTEDQTIVGTWHSAYRHRRTVPVIDVWPWTLPSINSYDINLCDICVQKINNCFLKLITIFVIIMLLMIVWIKWKSVSQLQNISKRMEIRKIKSVSKIYAQRIGYKMNLIRK